MSLLTSVHVALSLVGIAAGFVVLFGLLAGRLLGKWNSLFLVTTIATSVTGFFFPFHGVTPGIVVGVLSLIVLAIALLALHSKRLEGAWRKVYVITAMIALYFNVFVLIVQLFEKVPALHAMAPTQSESPFKMAQGGNLVLFVVLTIIATMRFARPRLRVD